VRTEVKGRGRDGGKEMREGKERRETRVGEKDSKKFGFKI
jgi:hypothetical protein